MLFTFTWPLLQQWLTFALQPHAPDKGLEHNSCVLAKSDRLRWYRGSQISCCKGAEAASALAPSPLSTPWRANAILHLWAQLLFNLTSWAVYPTALSISKTGCHCISDSSPIQKPIYVTWRQTNKVFGRVNTTSCPCYWIALTGRLY